MFRSLLRSSNQTNPASLKSTLYAGKGDRVVVLGSGWGGFQLALYLNKDIPLTVVSPRNHFLFTPLLPSASVGTLEFRCVEEPIRGVLGPNGNYYQATARKIDTQNKKVICDSVDDAVFEVEYDKLVIAIGAKNNTFGIESIENGANNPHQPIFFLKELDHARALRSNILVSFEKASLPNITDAERKRLLTFLVVGGGPTSCEFIAELHDFLKYDVKRFYPDLLPFVRITLIEAGPTLLGPFDKALQQYAQKLFRTRDIDVRLGTAVTNVEDFQGENYLFPAKRANLSDGTSLEFGTMVWAAGVSPRTLDSVGDDNAKMFQRHARTKRILVDEYLRVRGHEGSIWAIGDVAVNEKGSPLPQLAQVARQQGIYLAKVFNGKQREAEKPFKFFSMGSLAFLGEWKGIYDATTFGNRWDPTDARLQKAPVVTGFAALLLWRFAYWGRQVSMVNKILIPVYWFKSMIFGRDISRF